MSGTLSTDVRRALAKDARAIAQVHDAAWLNAYAGLIPAKELGQMITRRGPAWWERAIRRGAAVLVIEVGGVVAGYASYGPNRVRDLAQKGEIYEIYIMPEYQGIGLGTELFLAARRELMRGGYASLVVWALADNDGACRFYENAGGRRAARALERFGTKTLPKVAFVWSRKAA